MICLLLTMATALAEPEPTAFRCCTDSKIEAQVLDLVKLAELAATQPQRLAPRLEVLVRRHRAFNSLPPADRLVWDQIGSVLDGLSRPSREQALAALSTLSRHALYLALRYEGGQNRLAERLCPDGHTWLQRADQPPLNLYGPECSWGPPLQQKAPLPPQGSAR